MPMYMYTCDVSVMYMYMYIYLHGTWTVLAWNMDCILYMYANDVLSVLYVLIMLSLI